MSKIRTGRFTAGLDEKADSFNSSIAFDSRLYEQDIKGSMAHAAMLGAQKIIPPEDSDSIIKGLGDILTDLGNGTLAIDPGAEDIHMFIESELTARIGEAGKKLHTARSRNDQVALDLRMYLRGETAELIKLLKVLLKNLSVMADEYKYDVMPGYTHLQHAQPIVFGHHLMAYAMMFSRDMQRLSDASRRMNICPIGSCALAGTTYPADRTLEASLLGFDGICMNSLDGVSDRDFCVELMGAFSLIMLHLSRFSEELILWSSSEFGFIEFDDGFSTGSSIMPQKKNPDVAELVRGKTGRVYGDLMALLTTLKGLPLAYNKDMQEDKEAVFDSLDTVRSCLEVFTPMLFTMRVNRSNMLASASKGFMNATDLADYLTEKGIPFRTAYSLSARIVAKCIEDSKTLEELSPDEYKSFSELFGDDLYEYIDLKMCVMRRTSEGGTSPSSVDKQIKYITEITNENFH